MRTPSRRQRRGKPGSLANLKTELWHAVKVAGDLLDAEDADTRLRGCHALSQLAGAYRSLSETTDLEARLEAIEQRQLDAERQREADRKAGLSS